MHIFILTQKQLKCNLYSSSAAIGNARAIVTVFPLGCQDADIRVALRRGARQLSHD